MLMRNTTVSTNVIQMLQQSNHPVSMDQIMHYLNEKSIGTYKTTIQRILKKLVDQNDAIEIVLNNGRKFYELKSKCHSHHHHFICTDCDSLFCLNKCVLETLNVNLTDFLPNKDFQITSHEFNIYGSCGNCQSSELKK